MGGEAISGNLITVSRDLSEDLNAGEVGNNQIIAVHGFYVRGEIRLSDISFTNDADSTLADLADTNPISASASVETWRIYDNSPKGARISSVYDGDIASHVVQLSGSGMSNGYSFGGFNAELGDGIKQSSPPSHGR